MVPHGMFQQCPRSGSLLSSMENTWWVYFWQNIRQAWRSAAVMLPEGYGDMWRTEQNSRAHTNWQRRAQVELRGIEDALYVFVFQCELSMKLYSTLSYCIKSYRQLEFRLSVFRCSFSNRRLEMLGFPVVCKAALNYTSLSTACKIVEFLAQ